MCRAAPAPRSQDAPIDRSGIGGQWFMLLPLVVSAIVLAPVTGSYFFHDDFLNLYQIANDSFVQYVLTPNGGHVLVARNGIFYLTAKLFGSQPEYYYWTAYLTHSLNVALLFRLILFLTRSAAMASCGALLLGLSPCTVGTIGWYAVYGHALVATTLLIILNQALVLAASGRELSRSISALWYALALVAATSFGTGLGIALALPFALRLLLLLLPAHRSTPPLASLVIVIPLLYVGISSTYEWFSQAEATGRSLLQSQIGTNWALIPRYSAHLIALGLVQLMPGWGFDPWLDMRWWYVLLTGFVIALLAVVRTAPRTVLQQLGALVVLLLGTYMTVAIGRSWMLSVLSLDAWILQTRYHYVGQLLLTLLLCIAANQLIPPLRLWMTRAGVATWYGLIIVLWV